jgi:pyridoxamine 5'-phosphate oxidase
VTFGRRSCACANRAARYLCAIHCSPGFTTRTRRFSRGFVRWITWEKSRSGLEVRGRRPTGKEEAGRTPARLSYISLTQGESGWSESGINFFKMAQTPDPIEEFQSLLKRANENEKGDATACVLATCDRECRPSARVVLLKDAGPDGFSFFTNYGSRKARELLANPHAALCFYWPVLAIQVRIEGSAARVSTEESDRYFSTRPRESQLGAWASQQSSPLSSREELLERFQEAQVQFDDKTVPRPENWGGFLLTPQSVEFWWNKDYRLHDRVLYERSGSGWTLRRLFP